MTTEAKKKAPARADFMKALMDGTAATGGKPSDNTVPVKAAAASTKAAAPAAEEGGGIFVWGKQLVIEDKANESKILLRFPTSMLDELERVTTNTRTAAIVAIVGDAIMRAKNGEKLNFDTGNYAHFFKKS